MPQSLNVYFLPAEFEPDDVANEVVVVVDILRASTTITHALANGAKCVVPCGTVAEAFAARELYGDDKCLLGGERGGIKIDGFDLGNSPASYTRDLVSEKVVAFTTTNGTKALLRSSRAAKVIVGAFVNLSVVADIVRAAKLNVHIVCAGTDGRVTGEDVLFAGALVEALTSAPEFETTDAAAIALNHWQAKCHESTPATIQAGLLASQGGRNLVRLQYESDFAMAADLDAVPTAGIVGADGKIRQSSR